MGELQMRGLLRAWAGAKAPSTRSSSAIAVTSPMEPAAPARQSDVRGPDAVTPCETGISYLSRLDIHLGWQMAWWTSMGSPPASAEAAGKELSVLDEEKGQ